jgi:hypothetical protein
MSSADGVGADGVGADGVGADGVGADVLDADVLGADPDTRHVAASLGLQAVNRVGARDVVVVASSAADVDAIRDALVEGAHTIAAVVALRLDEDLVVALYDLGLPVAFGYCTPAELDEAIAVAPDAEGRRLAASLASIEHALSGRR